MNISKNINIYPVRKLSRFTFIGLTMLFFLVGSYSLNATHIVGGDITYKCLGFGDYEVTLTVRRDCENGEEPFDEIAAVGIFDGYGNLLPWFGTGGMIQMTDPDIKIINTDLDQGCAFIGEPVCVTEATYVGVVNLPVRTTGYSFSYQRCCRNVSLDNIIDPLNTGSTYTVRLLEETMVDCNSSPVFNQWPDVYICADQTLTYDMSATDAEGDSLAYKLCTPYDGASFEFPQPSPPAGPDYSPVEYKAPFSFNDPIPGTPLTIDVNTGLLTSVPNTIGQWLVGVCVEEWRDGELVTTVRRDFEYNTRICTAGPMASFDIPNPFCEGLVVEGTNTSTDADSYVWTVTPADGVVFNSTDENPTFTFPENGIYQIQLEAFRDVDGCSTVFIQNTGIYDSNLEASFTADITGCVADSSIVNLVSTSTDPDYEITSWEWTINTDGFSTTVSGETVQVTVPKNDVVEIILTVTSENGCESVSTVSDFDTDPLDLDFIANPIMVCAGDEMEILLNPNCDLTYSITPLDFVTFDDPTDPCVITVAPTSMIVYTITATNGICTESKDLTVDVIEKADLTIIGDSISCDGSVNLTVEGGLPGNQFEWSTSPTFMPLIGDMTNVLDYTMQDQSETIYVRVKDGTGCSNVPTYNIQNQSIDVSYPESFVACTNSMEEIVIVNNNSDHDLTIVFDDNDVIVSTTDSSVVIMTDNVDLNTQITFTITNQYDCTLEGTIDITAEQKPEIDFTFAITCGTLEMCFTNTTNPIDGEYSWDFGDLTTEDDVSSETNPCYIYSEPGTYEVTLTIADGACEGESVTKTVEVLAIPEIDIDGESLDLCLNEKANLTASTNVENGGTITWTNSDGDILGEGAEIMIMGMNSTTITATVVDAAGCEATDQIELNVYIFDVSITGPEISCVDEAGVVTVTNNSEGENFTYLWSPEDCILEGQGTTEIIASASDTKDISVLITNTDNGCDTTLVFTFNVSVISKAAMVDMSEPIYQCQEIEIFVDPADDGCTYLWDSGETESAITDTIIENTTYTVTITDENGCTLESSVTVDPELPQCDETDVYLPNAFSPNNDGTNDIFRVRSNFVKSMDLVVYNRWGEMLFQSTDINIGWDGTYNGDELAPDVYAFCLIATCSNGVEYKKTGNVTIVK